MAYPYTNVGRANQNEVLVFSGSTNNTTAASGVQTTTINIPASAYHLGVCVWTSGASSACTAKLFAFTDPAQTVAAKTGAISFSLYDVTTTAATVLTLASTSLVAGEAANANAGGSTHGRETNCYPYGLQLQTTCNTDSGTVNYKIIAAQRS